MNQHLFLPLALLATIANTAAQAPSKQALASPVAQTTKAEPDRLNDPRIQALIDNSWSEYDQKRYRALLAKKTCETLLAPVQLDGDGFDRATRSLMTAQLALALRADSQLCVSDPYLTSRALGDGARHIDDNALFEVARSIKAQTIVSTFASHDNANSMRLRFVIRHAADKNAPWLYNVATDREINSIQYSDEIPPFVAMQAHLGQVVRAAGGNTAPIHRSIAGPDYGVLPTNLLSLLNEKQGGALSRARRFQLLASLGPSPEIRATERMYEKAWIVANEATPSPELRRIQARSLLHLGYRPAALALLKNDRSIEADALRALLNGNLPDATAATEKIKSLSERLIFAIEVRELAEEYDQIKSNTPLSKALSDATAMSPDWKLFVLGRTKDRDPWYVVGNSEVKASLDRLLPIPGFSLQEILAGKQTLAEETKANELEVLPFAHVDKLIAKQSCCGAFDEPQLIDFLDLVEARASRNIVRQVAHLLDVQGEPEQANSYMDGFEARIRNNPGLSLLAANAMLTLLRTQPNERTEERHRLLERSAVNAAFWEHSLGMTSAAALSDLGVPSALSTPFVETYERDFPPRPYPYWLGRDLRTQKSMLAYAVLPPIILMRSIASNSDSAKTELLRDVDGRFSGSSEFALLKNEFTQNATLSSGERIDVLPLRQFVEKNPDNWDAYVALAKALIRHSQFNEASKATLAYPGFRDPGANTVALSNGAVQVARLLFWAGAFDAAKPLYQIAAGYNNGSLASLSARQRLFGLAGDYDGYASTALEAWHRYPGDYWMASDYLKMLFTTDSARAWAAFSRLCERTSEQPLWSAAIVGKRVGGESDEAVGAWLSSDRIKSIVVDDEQPAQRLALVYFMVDRKTPADLPQLIDRVEGTPTHFVDADGISILHRVGAHSSAAEIKSHFRDRAAAPRPAGEKVPSPYSLFAAALAELRSAKYDIAIADFDTLSTLYPLDFGDLNFAQPYFAMAAAKTGDKLELEKFLNAPVDPRGVQMINQYKSLTGAVFAGIRGDKENALRGLHEAISGTADTNEDVTAYEYADVSLWLYGQTHDDEYLKLALDWARKYQTMDPTVAWPYALEARFGQTTDPHRARSIAMASFLDRNSYWLNQVPKKDIEEVRKQWGAANPFRISKNSSSNDI